MPEKNDGETGAKSVKPFAKKDSGGQPARPVNYHPEVPRRVQDIPGMSRRPSRRGNGEGGGEARRLIVGREISLSGEITSCDKLVIEGTVEVTIPDSRSLEVTSTGLFKGRAEVDEADIAGRFEGELIVRERLAVRAGGRVTGSIRYGRIVIEAGGEVSGDMRALDAGGSEGAGPDK